MSIFSKQRSSLSTMVVDARSQKDTAYKRKCWTKRYSLLNLPIAQRLAYGFLIPALIACIALSSIGIQSVQLLTQSSTFYQNLTHTYTSLTAATEYLQLMHTTIQGTLNDANHPSGESVYQKTLLADQSVLQDLASRYNAIVANDIQHDALDQNGTLATLFTESGHGAQIREQRTLLNNVLGTWQVYHATQVKVMSLLLAGNLKSANTLEYTQAEQDLAGTISALFTLTQFDGRLLLSIHDAINVEENKLLWITIFAVLGVLLGIGIVGWLASTTLVRRLQQLRRVVQAVEKGQVNARLTVVGRDEIADVSLSVNSMLNTILGLLEATRQQHEALNEAETRATTDPLTSLPNHRTIMARIEEELSRCQRVQASCSVLFVDLDHFKHINDTYGHRAGDTVLREVAHRLTTIVRLEDLVGRYGGEEFAILLTDTPLDRATQVAQRLRSTLAETPCLWETEEQEQGFLSIPITASIGVAVYREHGVTRDALIEAADRAMYHAKHTGRNRVCLAGEETTFVQNLVATA